MPSVKQRVADYEAMIATRGGQVKTAPPAPKLQSAPKQVASPDPLTQGGLVDPLVAPPAPVTELETAPKQSVAPPAPVESTEAPTVQEPILGPNQAKVDALKLKMLSPLFAPVGAQELLALSGALHAGAMAVDPIQFANSQLAMLDIGARLHTVVAELFTLEGLESAGVVSPEQAAGKRRGAHAQLLGVIGGWPIVAAVRPDLGSQLQMLHDRAVQQLSLQTELELALKPIWPQ